MKASGGKANPKVVAGFVRATIKGVLDTIKDPDTAMNPHTLDAALRAAGAEARAVLLQLASERLAIPTDALVGKRVIVVANLAASDAIGSAVSGPVDTATSTSPSTRK